MSARRRVLPVAAVGLGLLAGLGTYSAIVAGMASPPTPLQRWWLVLAAVVAAVLGFLTTMAGGYWLGAAGGKPFDEHEAPFRALVAVLSYRGVAALLAGAGVVTLALLVARPVVPPAPGPSDATGPAVSGAESEEPAPAVTSASARLTATPQRPGGCSSVVVLEGEVHIPPPPGATLWLLSVRHADPAAGLDHALHFAKTAIPPQAGPFRIEQEPSAAPGERWGRWLLVQADAEADAELAANRLDAERGDRSYPDGRRIQLPPGTQTLAESAELVQRC